MWDSICPYVPEAVDVLRMALNNSVESVHEGSATRCPRGAGGKIAADTVEEYEVASRRQPDDLAVRILLLGYYFLGQFVSDAARMAGQAHVLWIIEHAPASHSPVPSMRASTSTWTARLTSEAEGFGWHMSTRIPRTPRSWATPPTSSSQRQG